MAPWIPFFQSLSKPKSCQLLVGLLEIHHEENTPKIGSPKGKDGLLLNLLSHFLERF